MTDIPTFKLFGEDDLDIQAILKPDLGHRDWEDLSREDKGIILQELFNQGWFASGRKQIFHTMSYLNHHFLVERPAPRLHRIKPANDPIHSNFIERAKAAKLDFWDYFLDRPGVKVYFLLSLFLKFHIKENILNDLDHALRDSNRQNLLNEAYEAFDRLAKSLNHIFEQFSLQWLVTRRGFIPRQEKKITDLIYQPTLKILSDPKWQSVDSDFSRMFDDFQNAKYSECIAKAHSAVQRFLQVIIGEEGKNGKGNFGQLFSEAKKNGLISDNQFTGPVVNAMQRYIPSERANNSTAKPAVKEATYSDALLMMNVVMVLIQHCLQNLNDGTKSV